MADLIYETCPESRPAADAKHPPRCGFEAWFGQPLSSSSPQRFRLYPRVAEVESEALAWAEALARCSKPLSQVLPRRSCKYTVADDPLYASSQPVNPSFAQLAGAKAVGSKRWGSISFSEMERVFWNQLEVTSSSLWLMSGILAMLKCDGFQPSDPSLFNTALSSVSAAMSQQARSADAGSTFCGLSAGTAFFPTPRSRFRRRRGSPLPSLWALVRVFLTSPSVRHRRPGTALFHDLLQPGGFSLFWAFEVTRCCFLSACWSY